MRAMLAALLLALAACSAPETDLRLALGGEPSTLDPHRYNLRIEETVLTDLFEGLVTFGADGTVQPGAAESWTVREDGLVWRFALRDDNRWSDGTPLTARDFEYSFRRLVDPTTAASLAYFMYPLKNAEAIARGDLPPDALGVNALSDTVLELTLEQPYPHLPERLLYPTAFPVPKHVIERVGDAWVKPEHWTSNGPYSLRSWRPRESLTLARNPHFHSPGQIEAMAYVPVSSIQNGYNRYRTGDLHAAGVPDAALEQARQTHTADYRSAPLQSAFYLVFNVRKPPFDDVRVRRALALLVDPTALTEQVLRAGGAPATTLVPAVVHDYNPPVVAHHQDARSKRAAEAHRLLADAGFSPEAPLTLTLRHATGAGNKKASLAVIDFWRSVGVQAELHQTELRAHYGALRGGEFEVAHAAWLGENNPEHYLGLLYGATGDTNYGGYANAAYDTLFERARAEANIEARHALLAKAEGLALADHAVVPLYSSAAHRVVDPRLKGWAENARDVHPVRYLYWADQ